MPQVRTLRPDGDAIRLRRLELGLTPREVADRIHRHITTIHKIERGGKSGITIAGETLVHQIARALETTPGTIIRADRETESAA
jgi:transcriptional regulator with XRE-family HTH domain